MPSNSSFSAKSPGGTRCISLSSLLFFFRKKRLNITSKKGRSSPLLRRRTGLRCNKSPQPPTLSQDQRWTSFRWIDGWVSPLHRSSRLFDNVPGRQARHGGPQDAVPPAQRTDAQPLRLRTVPRRSCGAGGAATSQHCRNSAASLFKSRYYSSKAHAADHPSSSPPRFYS